MKTIVIINEQHSLLPEQKEILKERFGSWKTIEVPASGWELDEMKEVKEKLYRKLAEIKGNNILLKEYDNTVVFVSPVPYLIKELSLKSQSGDWGDNPNKVQLFKVRVFHNDRREKKELPNGKVISVVAKTGWELV